MQPDDQLAALIDELRRDNDCIAAAQMDVSDRAQDHRVTKDKLDRATQELAAWEARAEITRRKVNRAIDARAHSMFDVEDGQ